MVTVGGAELLGGASDGAVCATFIRAWHGSLGGTCEELVALTPLDSRSGAAGKSAFGGWSAMAGAAESRGLDPLIWPKGHSGPYNLYHSVGVLKGRPGRGRGKKADVARLPGLWLDLDVGGGKFESEQACWDALRSCASAGLCPSIIVGSGSGGLHGYWIVDGGVEGGLGEQLNRRLRLWVMRGAGVDLDNVTSREHIMRLPGSVRWPKRDESGRSPSMCTVAWAEAGRRLDVSWLQELTEELWVAEEEAFTTRRAAFMVEDVEAMSALVTSTNEWGRLYRVAFFEQIFAERRSWESILEPHGWRLITDWHGECNGAPDGEGRRTWTRPGAVSAGKTGVNARSMQTDWTENPHVATLKSKCADTGLMRLVDAAVPLSKFRVWLELSEEWHGDLVRYMRAVADGTALELC